MRRALMTLTIAVAALTMAGTAPAAQSGGEMAGGAKMKMMVHTATGKLAKFDATANTLALSTAKGEQSFTLGSNTVIREGSKTIGASDLTGLLGRQVSVRYTEMGGQRTAQAVTITGAKVSKAKTAAAK